MAEQHDGRLKVIVLHKNQLIMYDFFRSIADIVHAPDPFHLIGGLELLSDALALGQLAGQQIQHGEVVLRHLDLGWPSAMNWE